VQDGLVNDGLEARGSRAGQYPFLPGQPSLHSFLDDIGHPLRHHGLDHGPGVLRCLQQPGHDAQAVVTDRDRFGFQAHIGGVRQARGLPRRSLFPLAGQVDEVLALVAFHSVEVAEFADVPLADAALAGFLAADLGGADQEALGDLLRSPAPLGP
jgi:hypothetical protein